MEKNEHNIFQDIPAGKKNGIYHSAILTTYAIDLIHLDTHVRNMLHRKHVYSINVLADRNQIDKALQYTNPMYLTHTGTDYCISNIASEGAFHPKISFFVGDESVLVLTGSGNLTVTGHGKSHEAFTGFMMNKDNTEQRPLIEECWRYLKRFAAQTGDFERRRMLHEVPENCKLLDRESAGIPHAWHDIHDGLRAALLYHEEGSSILSQIAALVPLDEVRSITVSSPFFDADGATLHLLLRLCPHAGMDVLIQESCSLPPYNMTPDQRIRFYDFDGTRRGKATFKDYVRLAHAKIFLFKTDDAEYCVVGSANATRAGLGAMERRGINDEFCVLYASKETDFLKVLGLEHPRPCLAGMNGASPDIPRDGRKVDILVRLRGASYEDGVMRIDMEGSSLPDDSCILLDDGMEVSTFKEYHIQGSTVCLKADIGQTPMLCVIGDKDNVPVSNKVFVNRIEQLDQTNPSSTTRMLNRFVSHIESKGYNGLEVVDMLTDIMRYFTEEAENGNLHIPHSCAETGKETDNALPQIRYNPEYDNDEKHTYRLPRTDRASRLIECIEESIRQRLRSMDEDIKDEEESGNTETSNQRTFDYDPAVHVRKQDIRLYGRQAASVLQTYRRLLSRRNELCNKKNGMPTKEDLCFFALSMFASMELCYLNRSLYDFGLLTGMDKSYYQKKLYDSLDGVMEHDGMETLKEFASFCLRHGKDRPHDKDFVKQGHRAVKYGLLYATLFFRFSTNEKYLGQHVIKYIGILAGIFGLPEKNRLAADFKCLAERYNHVFVFRDVEKTMKKSGIALKA